MNAAKEQCLVVEEPGEATEGRWTVPGWQKIVAVGRKERAVQASMLAAPSVLRKVGAGSLVVECKRQVEDLEVMAVFVRRWKLVYEEAETWRQQERGCEIDARAAGMRVSDEVAAANAAGHAAFAEAVVAEVEVEGVVVAK